MGTIVVIVSIIIVLYLVVFPWMDENTPMTERAIRDAEITKEHRKEELKGCFWMVLLLILMWWVLSGLDSPY